MALPHITIGIPAHNEEQRIRGFLTGLVRNTGPLLERKVSIGVIVVANGCNDRTGLVVEEFARSQGIPFDQARGDAKSFIKADHK